MKMAKSLGAVIFVTVMALIYIQLQVQIFDLAYRAKNKEVKIRKLLDDNGDVQYNICTLKSASHLGLKLLTEGSDMKFVEKDQIVKVKTPSRQAQAQTVSASFKSPASFLARIFSLKSQAEARTIK